MKALIIGSIVLDVVLELDHLPAYQQDVHVSSHAFRAGGCAYNVARIVNGYGCAYELCAPMGEGVYAEELARLVKAAGMEPGYPVKGEEGCCYCFIDEKRDRTFISNHGVEYGFDQTQIKTADPDIVYACGLEVEEKDGEALVSFIEEQKCQVIFAPGARCLHIPKDRLERIYKAGVILHVSEQEAKELSGMADVDAAVAYLHEKTHNDVICTLGAHGSMIFGEKVIKTEARKVDVVDTLGAGDSHCGGYISGILKGYDKEKALRLADLAAQCVISKQSLCDISE